MVWLCQRRTKQWCEVARLCPIWSSLNIHWRWRIVPEAQMKSLSKKSWSGFEKCDWVASSAVGGHEEVLGASFSSKKLCEWSLYRHIVTAQHCANSSCAPLRLRIGAVNEEPAENACP